MVIVSDDKTLHTESLWSVRYLATLVAPLTKFSAVNPKTLDSLTDETKVEINKLWLLSEILLPEDLRKTFRLIIIFQYLQNVFM